MRLHAPKINTTVEHFFKVHLVKIVQKKHFRVERGGLGSDAIASAAAAVRKRKW